MRTNTSPAVEPFAAGQTDTIVRARWYSPSDNRREALALRHRGYVHAGLIEASPFGIYTDTYDELPSTVMLGMFRRGACIGTLRLSFYAPGAASPVLPCEKVYPEVAGIKERAEGLVVELSRLAIDPSITNTRIRARLYAATIRAGMTACVAMDAKYLLVATQTKWRSFYEHVLGFKAVGPPQFYPPGDVPVELLERALDENLMGRIAKNLFFKIDPDELAQLRVLIPSLVSVGTPSSESSHVSGSWHPPG